MAGDSVGEVADDFLASLGLDDATIDDPNEKFWVQFTTGGCPKIALVRYWLIDEMSKFHHIRELHINITRNAMKDGKIFAKPLSQADYARAIIKYYLLQYHQPRFDKSASRSGEAADMDNIVERIIGHAPCREIIEKIPE